MTMNRFRMRLVPQWVVASLLLMQMTVAAPAGAVVTDYSWTTDGLTISNGVITETLGTGHATAANTFDRDYTVTATCVFKNHTAVVFCGPEGRQIIDAPSTFTQEAHALYIHDDGSLALRLHRLGEGTSQQVLAETPFTPTPGVEYKLTLILDGTTLTGCIDGGPCISATDSVLTEGSAGVGISASLSSNPSPEIIDFTYNGDVNPVPNGYDGTFSDDDGNVHGGMIEAIAADGITQGCSAQYPQYYCPFDPATRAQMATFLARAFELPASGTNWFPDDDGSTHEDAINAVAAAGITLGCGDGLYCPGDVVQRDQMASFIGRALGLIEINP